MTTAFDVSMLLAMKKASPFEKFLAKLFERLCKDVHKGRVKFFKVF